MEYVREKFLILTILLLSLCGCGNEVVYHDPEPLNSIEEAWAEVYAGEDAVDSSGVTEEIDESGSTAAPVSLSKEEYIRLYEAASSRDVATEEELARRIIARELTGNVGEGDATGCKEELTRLQKLLEPGYTAITKTDEKVFASAWLYKVTGDSSYRKDLEAILREQAESENGVICAPEEHPLFFYGLVAYLRTEHKTDYELSGLAMAGLFDRAIELSKHYEEDLERLCSYEDCKARSERDAELLLIANAVSMSIDYVRAAEYYLAICEQPESETALALMIKVK